MHAKSFGIVGIVCAALFLGLLGIKAGWWQRVRGAPNVQQTSPALPQGPQAKDVWINILQGGHKIGFGHEELVPTDAGIDLRQRLQMRLKTLGLVQDIRMHTEAALTHEYALKTFSFRLQSGSFRTKIEGEASPDGLRLTTTAGGDTRQSLVPAEMPIYLPAGVTAALGGMSPAPGDEVRYPFFDPASMGQATLQARYVGDETITIGGRDQPARHWKLYFKGANQSVWLAHSGEVLKEEGVLGISLERTTRDDALLPAATSPVDDLIQLAAIIPDRPISHVETRTRLQVEIQGIPHDYPSLTGGRQRWDGQRLLIEREGDSGESSVDPSTPGPADLQPAPLIESDHPKIRDLVKELITPGESPKARVHKILAWLEAHIERRPVVSVPSALATLEQRRGDCNEHAVLFAALARAAGIPTQVEAGIVYLKGRFYYHAWNRVYLNGWVTVDALFQQLPADVTHIRLARGTAADQLDILGVLGRLKIKVLEGG
jgi:hypothetical protein